MSDPVTNVQIEDVLSSIRRLVSADDRGEKEKETEQKKSSEQAPEALVLTPSLRVSSDQKSASDGEAEQGTSAEESPLAAHGTEPETAFDDAEQEQEPQLEKTAEADDGTARPDDWSDEEDSIDDDMRNDDGAEISSQDHSAAEALIQHDDETEDDDAPKGVFVHQALEDDHKAADLWSDDEARDEDNAENRPSEDRAADGEDDDREDDTDHKAENLSARVAGFEEAVAARDDGWEPDGDSDDENAAQPMNALPWQDDTAEDDEVEEAEVVSPTEGLDPFEPGEDDFSPEMVEEAVASAATNAFLDQDDPLGDEAAILDEEALRDLVTDIVREELQGALGERITRNVRKLVRREIHRALATQELE
jgi:hypothetical protein